MTRSHALALRLREVFLDGKWIANTNVKQEILSINWHEATQKISNLNSIAALTYHLNYYLKGLLHTFKTGKIYIDLESRNAYKYVGPNTFRFVTSLE